MDDLLAMPALARVGDDDGWATETLVYRVRPREKPKFQTVVDAKKVFGSGGGVARVETRVRGPVAGEVAAELRVTLDLSPIQIEDRLECVWREAGLAAGRLCRTVGQARKDQIDFTASPFPLPAATYPEVLLPFLMRGQPLDGRRRALYAWTSDRFVARVYYESRGTAELDLPVGRLRGTEVWMYPDLNDWVRLGSVLTAMAKPFLPRYSMWFEAEPTRRLLRFEGSYGPPGAPEIVLELAG